MSNKIRIKIDVKKLNKDWFFNSEKGAVYADLTIIPNKQGKGTFGDTHFIVQDPSKAARDAGQKGPIIGNGKELDFSNMPPAQNKPRPKPTPPPADDDTDIPF